MPRDKTANHIKVLAAARQEFLEYGFERASMRSIGERCGLTAAGLYRHCSSKEDLFDQLVSPAAKSVNEWLTNHIARYLDAAQGEEKLAWKDSEADMMREIIYPNMGDYHLLLAKSKGTKYEDFLHELTRQHQQKLWSYLPRLRAEGNEVWDIDPEGLHLLLTAYTTALFEPVIHNDSLNDALHCLETVEAFFLPGWKKLMGF